MNYERIYNQIIERAKNRILEGYTERHHIIPRCMGGGNSSNNIVELTAREHFICHKLLCEIYPMENGLVFAYWMLCKMASNNQVRQYRITAREYEQLRTEYSRVLKQRIPWNKGLTKNDPRVAKYAKAKRWNTGLKKGDDPEKDVIMAELYRKSSEKRKGKKFTEEHKKNLSIARKGRIVSDETRMKLKGRKYSDVAKENIRIGIRKNSAIIRICPKCGKIGKGGNMLRYHFDNCKV